MPSWMCDCPVPGPRGLSAPAQCLGEQGMAGSGSSQGPSSIPLAKGRILPCPVPGSAGASSLAMCLSGSVPIGCQGTPLSLVPF